MTSVIKKWNVVKLQKTISKLISNERQLMRVAFFVKPILNFSTKKGGRVQQTKSKFDKLTIVPNPSKGNFKLNFYGNEEASVSIRIIDLTGNTIINEQFNAEIGFNTKDFNLEGLSKGIYLIELTNGIERISGKIIIG